MSPYKDPEKAKEYAREAMKRQRQGITENRVVIPKNVIPAVIPKLGKTMPSGGRVTPALLDALTDKTKRQKLERIVEALGRRDLGGEVRFGVNGVTFLEIEELLETTT